MKTALISRKGGVGKTTSAVSLSAALAERGYRVLLIDLDAQGSASLSLGVSRAALAPSSADVVHGRLPLAEAIRRTSVPGLDLVTGSVDLISLERDLATSRDRERCLVGPLAQVEHDYDLIFMDCPAGLSLLTTAALAAADAYLVMLTPQFLVLDGLDNFLRSVERACYRTQSRGRLLGMLLTLVDYRVRITREYVEQIRADYGDKVLTLEVRVNVRLAEAPSTGQTIFQHDPHSTGAGAYRLLAEEFLLRSGFLSRQELELERSEPSPAKQPIEPAP